VHVQGALRLVTFTNDNGEMDDVCLYGVDRCEPVDIQQMLSFIMVVMNDPNFSKTGRMILTQISSDLEQALRRKLGII